MPTTNVPPNPIETTPYITAALETSQSASSEQGINQSVATGTGQPEETTFVDTETVQTTSYYITTIVDAGEVSHIWQRP